MVTQSDQSNEVDGIHGKHQAKQKSRLSRLWRSFSRKKPHSYAEFGPINSDSVGNLANAPEVDGSTVGGQTCFVETDFTPQVKKEGFLRRSFRRSRRKKREPKDPFPDFSSFRTESVPTTEYTVIGSSTVSSNNDNIPTTDNDHENAGQQDIHICTVNADEGEQTPREQTPGGVSREHFDSSSNNKVTEDGDMTPIQLALQRHSEISEDIIQSAERSYKFERSVSFKNRACLDDTTTITPVYKANTALSKLTRKVSFQKGVVIGYSDLNDRDPVEVAENYTPYPDLSPRVTHQEADSLDANNQQHKRNYTSDNKTSENGDYCYSDKKVGDAIKEPYFFFDKDIPEKSPKTWSPVTKLDRKVSRCAISSYSDLGAVGEDDEVFMSDGSVQFYDHPQPSSGSEPGSEQNISDMFNEMAKQKSATGFQMGTRTESWERWQTNRSNNLQTSHHPGGVQWNFETFDNESAMSVGSSSSPSTPSVSNHERRVPPHIKHNPAEDVESDSEEHSTNQKHIRDARFYDQFQQSRRISPNKKTIVTKYEELGISTDTLDSTCTLPTYESMDSEVRLGEFGRGTPKRKSQIKKIFGKKNSKGSPRGERF